jgi:hypothetical protein
MVLFYNVLYFSRIKDCNLMANGMFHYAPNISPLKYLTIEGHLKIGKIIKCKCFILPIYISAGNL